MPSRNAGASLKGSSVLHPPFRVCQKRGLGSGGVVDEETLRGLPARLLVRYGGPCQGNNLLEHARIDADKAAIDILQGVPSITMLLTCYSVAGVAKFANDILLCKCCWCCKVCQSYHAIRLMFVLQGVPFTICCSDETGLA